MNATYLQLYWDAAKSSGSFWGESQVAGKRLVLASFEWPPMDVPGSARKTRHIVFLLDDSGTPLRSINYEPSNTDDGVFLAEAIRDGSRGNHGRIASMTREEFWNVALDKLFGSGSPRVAAPGAGTPVSKLPEPSQSREPESAGSELLLSSARPDLYRRNAFRIMGLSVEASSGDITRQLEKVRMAVKYGGGSRPQSALPLVPPADVDAIQEAADRLRDPERRLVDEFFWFWPHVLGGSQNDEALTALRRREEEQAATIWRRQGNLGSSSNVSIHNLAVLMHLQALDQEFPGGAEKQLNNDERAQLWKSAYQMWKVLLTDEGFWSRLTVRIRDLDDPRLTTGTARRMKSSLPLALLRIQAQLAVRSAEAGNADEARWHLARMRESGFSATVIEEAIQLGTEPLRSRARTASHAADKESDVHQERGAEIAERLLQQCQPILAALDIVLPEGNPARDGIHDEIAIVILGCQIVFARTTDNWRKAVDLLEKAQAIAAGAAARSRIGENLKICRSNRDINTCFFCTENDGNEKCAISKPMFGDVERLPNFDFIGRRTGTKITWRSREVKVPRCLRCKTAQARSAGWTAGAIVASIATGIVSAIVEAHLAVPGLLVVVLLFGFAVGGGGVGAALSKSYFRPNIRPESDANKYEDIKDLLKRGWRFGTKPVN
jgi:hypothetical protein